MDINVAKQQVFWSAISKSRGSAYLQRLHRQIIKELDDGGLTANLYDDFSRVYRGSTWNMLHNGSVPPTLLAFNPTAFTRGASQYVGFNPFVGYKSDLFFFLTRNSGISASPNLYRTANEYEAKLQNKIITEDGGVGRNGVPITIRRVVYFNSWHYMFANPDKVRALSTPDFFKFIIGYLVMFTSTGYQKPSFSQQFVQGLTQGAFAILGGYLGSGNASAVTQYSAQALILGINYASAKSQKRQQDEYNNIMNEIEATREASRTKKELEDKKLSVENSYQKELEYNFDLQYETPTYENNLYEKYDVSYPYNKRPSKK